MMKNSTHTLRDMPIFIPQFSSADAGMSNGPGNQSGAGNHEAEQGSRYRANVLDLQHPVIEIRSLANSQYRFTLRSRVNAGILSGQAIATDTDLTIQASRIAQLCTREDRLRIERQASGFRINLLDGDDAVLGCTGLIASESLARATQKLIAIQARQARIDLI